MRSDLPQNCVSLIADAAQLICSALDSADGRASIIIADRPGSFLEILMRTCGGSAQTPATFYTVNPDGYDKPITRHVNDSSNKLAMVDGLQFEYSDNMFLPEVGRKAVSPIKTHSLDSLAAFLPNLAAIALGQDAMKAEVWKGSLSLLQKIQPVLVGIVAGLAKVDFSALEAIGYQFITYKVWVQPKQCAAIMVAIPPRLVEQARSQAISRFIFPEPEVSRPKSPQEIPVNQGRQVVNAKLFASQMQAKRGLYPFEIYGDLQWAWTGPGERTDLELPQVWFGPHIFLINIPETRTPLGLSSLKFLVNQRACPAEITELGIVVKANIPIEEFSGVITLSIITPNPQLASMTDHRLIGSSIASIEVFWS